MARYLGHAAVARLLVVPDDAPFTWPNPPVYNFIDELVDAKLKKMRYVPSPLCSDEEFIRRACLDATGTLPKPEEVEAFLADSTPSREKRRKYIDDLFDRPEFATYWTLQWDDWLHNHGRFGTIKPMFTLRNWVQASLRNNKPMDQFATRTDHQPRQYLPRRAGQLLSPAQRAGERGRGRGRHFPRRSSGVCQVPPSSLREVDAGRLLWPGRLLCPRRRERCATNMAPFGAFMAAMMKSW